MKFYSFLLIRLILIPLKKHFLIFKSYRQSQPPETTMDEIIKLYGITIIMAVLNSLSSAHYLVFENLTVFDKFEPVFYWLTHINFNESIVTR